MAVISGLVGYGAWYTYKSNGTELSGHNPTSAQQARLSSSAAYSFPDPAEVSAAERKAVIVGADSLYTGAIQGDGPVSKDTDDAGRKVLEMLTPEQATQKLRRNEESYLVGRGKGVVRYDVVQIPSNDPIEDDHSEKIIELPQASATKNPVSDWMFWGVFDGHAYVYPEHWATSTNGLQRMDNICQTKTSPHFLCCSRTEYDLQSCSRQPIRLLPFFRSH